MTGNYDRFDMVRYSGSRADLLATGAAAEYMFDQLGDNSGSRSGPTEFGDKFTLHRRKNDFDLLIWTFDRPQQPFGMAKVDPYDTDISEILAQFDVA